MSEKCPLNGYGKFKGDYFNPFEEKDNLYHSSRQLIAPFIKL